SRSVSGTASKASGASGPVGASATVRQHPEMQIESPRAASCAHPAGSTTILTAPVPEPSGRTSATRPTACTSPVNMVKRIAPRPFPPPLRLSLRSPPGREPFAPGRRGPPPPPPPCPAPRPAPVAGRRRGGAIIAPPAALRPLSPPPSHHHARLLPSPSNRPH